MCACVFSLSLYEFFAIEIFFIAKFNRVCVVFFVFTRVNGAVGFVVVVVVYFILFVDIFFLHVNLLCLSLTLYAHLNHFSFRGSCFLIWTKFFLFQTFLQCIIRIDVDVRMFVFCSTFLHLCLHCSFFLFSKNIEAEINHHIFSPPFDLLLHLHFFSLSTKNIYQ